MKILGRTITAWRIAAAMHILIVCLILSPFFLLYLFIIVCEFTFRLIGKNMDHAFSRIIHFMAIDYVRKKMIKSLSEGSKQ